MSTGVTGASLNQIIITAQFEMKLCQAKLEVEESGRLVARLQGNVAGYKKLIANIAARYHLTQIFLDDTGDNPLVIPDLEDENFELLRHDVEMLRISDQWKEVIAAVDANIVRFKDFLLYEAEKTRDLDLTQGDYEAQTVYGKVFKAVEEENQRRKAEAAKKAKERNEMIPGLMDDLDPLPKRTAAERVVNFPGSKSAAQ
jgi:hypothetical protein